MKKNKNLFGVIGNPISHSKSPEIHILFSKQKNIPLIYKRLSAERPNFFEVVNNFILEGGKGMNVTLPFKEMAYDLSANLSNEAKIAKAVNTLTFKNNQIYGDNTDGVGFIYDIEKNYNQLLSDKKILILGLGGATRGILGPIIDKKPSLLRVLNRSEINKVSIYKQYNFPEFLEIDNFKSLNDDKYDLIINATSAGKNSSLVKFPDKHMNKNAFFYDLSYDSKDTEFMLWAKKNGAQKLAQGWGMLVEQAAESFKIWHGERPITNNIREEIQ